MTARKLHISEQLFLPLDTVTSTMIVYGGKGMGKTNFGSVLAEECDAAGIRFSVIDPMGVWWGLRHSPDGKGRGIEVLILGGIHGDIPIEPTGGAVVADLVVDEAANVIIDISRRPDGTMWAIAERVRFVRDYCKRLYQRQGEQRRPILQFIDEAARFIPQVIRKDDSDVAACMGAIAVLVEEGRNVGVGVALITQRSARLNKDVAELADCMIAFRTVGPNSRRAVLDWLGEHVEKDKIKGYDQQVRALARGTALVVSPGWLEYEGIVPMRARRTFDSSATPKGGKQLRAKGPGAKPDLAKYLARMAATIERAKAEDPKALQQRVAQLEKQLGAERKRTAPVAKVPAGTPAPAIAAELRQTLKQADSDRSRLARQVVELKKLVAALEHFILELGKQEYLFGLKGDTLPLEGVVQKLLGSFGQQLGRAIEQDLATRQKGFEPWRRAGQVLLQNVAKALQQETQLVVPVPRSDAAPPARPVTTPAPMPATARSTVPADVDSEGIGKVEQRLLDQLAELEAFGIERPRKAQLAFFVGYTNPRSGSFSEPMGRISRAGLIEYPVQGSVQLTDAGRARANASDVPASTEALQERILGRLDRPQAKLLGVLIEVYPEPISKVDLAARCGYTNLRSGSFSEPLGGLSRGGLVEYPVQGQVRAADALFLEAAHA